MGFKPGEVTKNEELKVQACNILAPSPQQAINGPNSQVH
jgi:hypothetical protein